MKVAILGASGIIGQHMRLCIPEGIEPIWVRSQEDLIHKGVDLTNWTETEKFLNEENPNVIVNLAGESRPDVVQFCPELSYEINTILPINLCSWCSRHEAKYIHISSQAVFSGQEPYGPPYNDRSPQGLPVNEYGIQKQQSEENVRAFHGTFDNWTILRPTFVLGIRPLPLVGRSNPVEQILSGKYPCQVNDRFFSVSRAEDVAKRIWEETQKNLIGETHNIGIPVTVSRQDIANLLEVESKPVPHSYFKDIAPRPLDTTYFGDSEVGQITLREGLLLDKIQYEGQKINGIWSRANEISIFTGLPQNEVLKKLSLGFGPLHQAVSEDFVRFNPQTDEGLLEWYRTTEAYIWELSAYHFDPGFNYMGMVQGIGQSLISKGVKRILCLGDGIGDLTLTLHNMGLEAIYHDLDRSKTFKFAQLRYWMHTGKYIPYQVTGYWNPPFGGITSEEMDNLGLPKFDAVVALDFLEHLTDVDVWLEDIYKMLNVGGFLCAHNAFGMGSGPNGGMPMHLDRNDRFVTEWDPTLNRMGFKQITSNWYQK